MLFDFFVHSHRRLSNINRFNTRICTTHESVAAHSYYVTLYAMVLVDELSIRHNIHIDMQSTLQLAVLHDIEECIMGDIVRTIKKHDEYNQVYNTLSIDAVQEVFRHTAMIQCDKYCNIWNTQHDNIKVYTPAWVVKVADDLSGIVYCHEQLRLGNTYFESIYNDYKSGLHNLLDNTVLSTLSGSL